MTATSEPRTTRHSDHIKSRQRVRDLAEVYTHEREVTEMLDLVPDMFPTVSNPSNTDRKFLEPACGSGNFLEAILKRKLAFVTTKRYGMGERYEHRILRALASIYAIDIDEENVIESRDRLRAVIDSDVNNELNTRAISEGFADAVEVILETNLVHADALKDANSIRFVDYRAGRSGTFTREWSPIRPSSDLFALLETERDEQPVHYSEIAAHPGPVTSATTLKKTKKA